MSAFNISTFPSSNSGLVRLGQFFASRRNLLVLLLIGIGILLRTRNLSDSFLWSDEAESAINALTILEHGVPTDKYLGLPIFENTLTRPWADSREYEFKDTSYSDRGVAVYHGWLPLYTIAASFKIFGIVPDKASDGLKVHHSWEEMRWRTIAARAPSIVFAAIFLFALFLTGRAFYGPNAGLVALTIGTFTPNLIWSATQARYYSATLAFGALGLLYVWLVFRRGAWRDFLGAGLLLVLLFHTHLLTFGALAFAFTLTLPVVFRRPGAFLKLAATAGVVSAGILPWVWATGFLDAAGRLPMARSLLSFPEDLLLYPRMHPGMGVLIAGAAAELSVVLLFRRRLPARIAGPFAECAFVIASLIGFLLLCNFLFMFFTPAASFFLGRLTLMTIVPAVLLTALLLDANARVLSPRNPGMVLTAILVAGLAFSWKSWLPHSEDEATSLHEIIDYLRSENWRSTTRIYALPLDHLGLMFYTGMPIQSVAPLRKEFLDDYENDIVILERTPGHALIPIEALRHQAGDAGELLGAEDLHKWQQELSTRPMREQLAMTVKDVDPPLKPLPPWAGQLLEQRRAELVAGGTNADAEKNPAMFRGYGMTDRTRFWPVFYYRFVNPERRSGPNLNYASRIRSARAVVLSSWVIYHCDGRFINRAAELLKRAS